ncbi:hypothetical protein WA026_002592, partial [Henosepilachna vigintioctopunctata]
DDEDSLTERLPVPGSEHGKSARIVQICGPIVVVPYKNGKIGKHSFECTNKDHRVPNEQMDFLPSAITKFCSRHHRWHRIPCNLCGILRRKPGMDISHRR